MTTLSWIRVLGAPALLALLAQPAFAPPAGAAETKEAAEQHEVTDTHDPGFKPEFTEGFLSDEDRIAAGQEIWEEQCRHCHGKSAYPGKAPKLKPKRYKPEFVYKRITDGFRKMPPWKDVYTDQERMDLVAYILSKKFSP